MPNAAISRNRFATDPIVNLATGEPITLEITPDDIKLFHALAFHYHYLNPEYAAALLGRSYDPITRRLRLLRKNGKYIRLSPEQEENKRQNYWGWLFYAINGPGLTQLAQQGYDLTTNKHRHDPANLKHQVMDDQIMASIEIGVNANPAMEIKWWETVYANMPAESRTGPLSIPLSNGKEHHADGLPFALRADDRFIFVVKETDVGTEPIDASNGARSSVKRHLLDYADIIENRIYAKHFGSRSFFVLFTTTTLARKQSIMKLWEAISSEKPKLRKCIGFTTHPTYTGNEKPQATGHMLTREIERVGNPPVILNNLVNL